MNADRTLEVSMRELTLMARKNIMKQPARQGAMVQKWSPRRTLSSIKSVASKDIPANAGMPAISIMLADLKETEDGLLSSLQAKSDELVAQASDIDSILLEEEER